jgi:HK97 family phage prohead protease
VDHDHTKSLARRSNGSLRIKEDAVGLAVEIDVPNTTWGNDLLACVESDLVAGMSLSLICEEDRDKVTIDGQVWPLRTVVQCSTDEVTATSIPAYPDTTLSTRSYFPEGLPESVELRPSAASRATNVHLGVVPFAAYDVRSEGPFNSIDEANGIFNWSDGEDEDRSADSPVANKLKSSQIETQRQPKTDPQQTGRCACLAVGFLLSRPYFLFSRV